jgi:hypothetical protein
VLVCRRCGALISDTETDRKQPTPCRRSPETGEDDQRTSGMTISEVRVLLSS